MYAFLFPFILSFVSFVASITCARLASMSERQVFILGTRSGGRGGHGERERSLRVENKHQTSKHGLPRYRDIEHDSLRELSIVEHRSCGLHVVRQGACGWNLDQSHKNVEENLTSNRRRSHHFHPRQQHTLPELWTLYVVHLKAWCARCITCIPSSVIRTHDEESLFQDFHWFSPVETVEILFVHNFCQFTGDFTPLISNFHLFAIHVSAS